MSDRIMTLHPDPDKKGVNIDREKYEAIKDALIDILKEKGEVRFGELPGLVSEHLPAFDGSVSWYVTTVKLDLEARKIIERIPGRSP